MIIIGTCYAIFLVVLLITSWPVFIGSFLSLEDREIEQDIKQALSTLDYTVDQLSISVGDYSGWDESYRFIQDANREFIKTNLDDKIFPMLRIDMLLYVDLSGRIVYEQGIDHLSTRPISLESLHPYITRDSPLVQHDTPKSEVSGILRLPEGPLLIASRPILTSRFTGPVRGALIMARFLDAAELAHLREISLLPIRIFPVGDRLMPADVRAFLQSPASGKSLKVYRKSPDRIAGYSMIENVFGEPALVLEVEIPRSAYRQGVIAIRYFTAWVGGIGLAAAVTASLLYFRMIKYRQKELETQALYSSVVQQASEGIVLVDPADKRILEANTAFAEILGYSKIELRGMTLYEIFAGPSSGVDKDVAGVKISKQRFLGERTFRRKDGGLVLVEQSANIIPGEKEVLCMVLRDITERKRVEEILREKGEQLEALNSTLEQRVQDEVAKNREKDHVLIQQNRQAAMGEMVDHIAHQWKQPLTSLSITAQLLEDSYRNHELTDELVEEATGKMEDLVQHMSQTIEVFRDFYSPDKRKIVFNIKESIDLALSFIASALRLDSIEVEMEAEPRLMAAGYPKEYTQVLLNLLSNARDALKQTNPEKPRIKISGFAEDNRVVVLIADNAGGIPEGIMERIFDPYFSTKGESGGTGVGLYMSRNIIEKNMGGKLEVRMIEKGAEFRIEVPCALC
ncbi:MAG: CHASE4 domain-containing protein [Syntrophotaleaceae bacterium]